MTTPEPLLDIRDLVQQRADGFRLTIASFSLLPGRSYAITGPNGSGKTTLLRTFGLVDPPIEGRMRFEGRDLSLGDANALTDFRRQTTLVMQHAFLFRGSVFDNVAYGLRFRRVPSGTFRSRVAQALKQVGLVGFEGRNARRLSGGESQRVALARALAVEPRLLLLDEPTAGVDTENADVIETAILRMREERRMGVVFSTHQWDQAYRLADEVSALRDGRMLDAGPVNLFSGEARDDGTTVVLHPGVVLQTVTDRRGPVHVHIDAEDIIVSRQPLASSARNSLIGTIVRAAVTDPFIDLTVDVGVLLSVRITRQSFAELGLNMGDRVAATFKSSAVRIL
ncbi:MAG: ATP-binding cassette domain-containing protein [candidate division Zixibacteria bacterium]|nr:ATP-binding cassette domain-containing protein [candidate division Zixibacteria bacterium]